MIPPLSLNHTVETVKQIRNINYDDPETSNEVEHALRLQFIRSIQDNGCYPDYNLVVQAIVELADDKEIIRW